MQLQARRNWPRHWGTAGFALNLVGEGGRGRKFDRGVSRYPSIGDVAHVITSRILLRSTPLAQNAHTCPSAEFAMPSLYLPVST